MKKLLAMGLACAVVFAPALSRSCRRGGRNLSYRRMQPWGMLYGYR